MSKETEIKFLTPTVHWHCKNVYIINELRFINGVGVSQHLRKFRVTWKYQERKPNFSQ